ncbi:MAG: response regulator [Acidobacteriota bacterium]
MKLLRVLIVEDNEDDATLILRELRRGGYEPLHERVETGEAMLEALQGREWDLVTSDYSMPAFSGPAALQTLKETGLDLPFIIVSGTIGEETAVAALKAGAHDFVVKSQLARFLPAVERELGDARVRRLEREAQRTAQDSAAQLRAIFDAFPDLFFRMDLNGTILDCHAGKGAPLHLAPEAFLGRRIQDALPAEAGGRFAGAFRLLREAGDAIAIEYELPTPNGGHWYEARLVPLPESQVVAVVRDVSDRRRAEELLRKSRQMLQLVLDNIPQRVFWKDRDSVYLGCNRPMAQDAGLPNADAIAGKRDAEMPWKEAAQTHVADDRQVMETNSPKLNFEESLPVGKEIRRVRTSKVPLCDGGGAVVGLLGTYEDITEQKKLEAQFLRAQRLECIGTLASGIAHDLNNVLAPIMMSLDVLRERLTAPDDAPVVDTIATATQRGADIVKQILSFARGGIEGERLVLQPGHLIRDLVEKILKQTFPKSIRIATEIAKDLWTVNGDPTQLQQVFLNLCVNARDAMPSGGVLTMRAENASVDAHCARMHIDARPGSYVAIEVSDTGTGIPPEVIDKVFDPFFTTKEPGKGTGLGLATTLSIVKSHGGFINLYSELGTGTRLKVYLPSTTTGVAASPGAPEPNRPKGAGEMIILVDDEASVRDVTAVTLRSNGYRILTAGDGAEAVALLAQHPNEVNLVLTDMMMPILDGAATIRAVRKLNPSIKVIASSGLSEYAAIVEAQSLGIQGFLAKPYTAEALLKAVHEVITRDRKQP